MRTKQLFIVDGLKEKDCDLLNVFKGNSYTLRVGNSVKIACLHSEKGSTLKESKWKLILFF